MEDLADTLAASAQNLMNSYNQMAANVAAMEKNVEAAQSSYDASVKKRSAGLIKDTELESEKSSLEQQQNSLASLKEQQSELKESLLTLLGLSGRTDVEIGTVRIGRRSVQFLWRMTFRQPSATIPPGSAR